MFTWVSAQFSFIALRFINSRKLSQYLVKNDTKSIQRHTAVLFFLIIYSAFLWSAATLLGLKYAPTPYEYVSFTMIIGIVTAGALTLAPFFHVYVVYFSIMTFSQLVIMFYLGESYHHATVLMVFVFIPLYYFFSRSIYLDNLNSIKMNESLEATVSELHNLSVTDFLTGVFNRRHFFPVGEGIISLSLREDKELALLVCDIDHFKKINDQYGHHIGDKALVGVVECLQQHIRESDIFARVGGEEFAVLLNNTSKEGAMIIAEKLRLAVSDHIFVLNETELNITVSIGVAMLNDKNSTMTHLCKEADEQLYLAKEQGRNCVCV